MEHGESTGAFLEAFTNQLDQRPEGGGETEQGEDGDDFARDFALQVQREQGMLGVFFVLQRDRAIKAAGKRRARLSCEALCLDLCQGDFSVHRSLPLPKRGMFSGCGQSPGIYFQPPR